MRQKVRLTDSGTVFGGACYLDQITIWNNDVGGTIALLDAGVNMLSINVPDQGTFTIPLNRTPAENVTAVFTGTGLIATVFYRALS